VKESWGRTPRLIDPQRRASNPSLGGRGDVFPRDEHFFDLFEAAADNMAESARLLDDPARPTGQIATAQPVRVVRGSVGCLLEAGAGVTNALSERGMRESVMEFIWDLVVFLVLFAAGLVVLGLLARSQ
jgi:hypothetical protein